MCSFEVSSAKASGGTLFDLGGFFPPFIAGLTPHPRLCHFCIFLQSPWRSSYPEPQVASCRVWGQLPQISESLWELHPISAGRGSKGPRPPTQNCWKRVTPPCGSPTGVQIGEPGPEVVGPPAERGRPGRYLLVSSGTGSTVLTGPFACLPPGEILSSILLGGNTQRVFTVIYSMYNKVNIAHA